MRRVFFRVNIPQQTSFVCVVDLFRYQASFLDHFLQVQEFLLLLKVSRLECWASLCHADFWICLTNQLMLWTTIKHAFFVLYSGETWVFRQSERAQVLLINITNSDKTLVFDQSERAQGPIYLTIIPWAHVGYESAITSLISNKREWNNCFIKNASKI